LALTRVVLAGPRFALLDRVETTLGPDQVRQALERLTGNSITPIHLAGAAQSLEPYDAVLEIDPDGEWSWRWTGAEPMRDRGDEAHGRGEVILADANFPTE
jgi:vitamin B12/bleomycin/antimicrobial peptide transport system ATP-binding/permease protein